MRHMGIEKRIIVWVRGLWEVGSSVALPRVRVLHVQM